MSHKDDLLRAAEIIVSCSDLALGFPHAKEYADLASRLRAAAPLADDLSAARRELAEARELLDKWTGDGHLQTFEDRERFRREYRLLKSPAQGATINAAERFAMDCEGHTPAAKQEADR